MNRRASLRIAALAVFALVITGGFLLPANEPEAKDRGVKIFMREKLAASSKILEGLATENFAQIREGAKTLQTMSKAEQWRLTNDALYRQYSTEFNKHAETLHEKANARNLDGATLAWMECTMSCVRCHKHVRAIKIAGTVRP